MARPDGRIPLFERLLIESQSLCNRSCWFCARTYDRGGSYLDAAGEPVRGRMETEKILDLLDQARALGFHGRVGFHHYSEPLLDKRNTMLARAARDRGMEPYLHTNGDAIRENDALRGEVLSAYHIVIVGLYDYRSNEELEREKEFWGARLQGVDLAFSAIGPDGAGAAYSMGVPRAVVPTDDRMSIPDLTFANAPCHRPLIRLIIRYDGEICNCCEDTTGAFALGNVYRDSIEELWFSERHAEVVEDLVAGRRERFALCRNCPATPTGIPPEGAIEMAPRRYVPDPLIARAASGI